MQRSLDQETLEYRWMTAALACCAVGLVTATIMLTTGNRFEFRPAPPEISRLDDELVSSFNALGSMTAKRAANPPQARRSGTAGARNSVATGAESPGTPRKRRIVVRLKSPWCTGVLRNQAFYRCRTQSW
ncbi:hypothetical protein [Bradyrhizobium sp.]|uniref:hypothetical protein n=1 Tax=Bradyrhizobium sp. TaxID=376 RepID=UPI001D4235E6|nr:hypothetical protein [Bradyrhizobium sp.]MBI5322540.1 hypothetical protein [Bradyrhizobium sp.]